MSLPKHRRVRSLSRKLIIKSFSDLKYPCEARLEGCTLRACEIHHIENNYRGSRNDDNPKALIAVCRHCHHIAIHGANDHEMRDRLLKKVEKILSRIARSQNGRWKI